MKKQLGLSFLILLGMIMALSGVTYAWWTDSVTVQSRIQAGRLDLMIEACDDIRNPNWEDIGGKSFFDLRYLEPGSYGTRYLKVTNVGNTDLAYIVKNTVHTHLENVITFKIDLVTENGYTSDPQISGRMPFTVMLKGAPFYVLLEPGEYHIFKVSYFVDEKITGYQSTLLADFTSTIEAKQTRELDVLSASDDAFYKSLDGYNNLTQKDLLKIHAILRKYNIKSPI